MQYSIQDRINILPYDGEVFYFGKILPKKQREAYFEKLLTSIEWAQDEVIIFGKRIVTKRMTGWYGEDLVEENTGLEFNSCLLNLYHSGEEGMSWHSDAEAELGKDPAIASLSLGATRKFMLKHKTSREKISLELESGSLLLMQGETQKNWLHSLPKTKKVKEPRINLTFRNIRKIKK